MASRDGAAGAQARPGQHVAAETLDKRNAFPAAVCIIGGLGSMWGTLAGGVIIGVAQAIGAKLDPGWNLPAGHIAFLIVLLIRPRGLFPRAVD